VSAECADQVAFGILCGCASLAAGGGFATHTPAPSLRLAPWLGLPFGFRLWLGLPFGFWSVAGVAVRLSSVAEVAFGLVRVGVVCGLRWLADGRMLR
jgi:hypothetical protein